MDIYTRFDLPPPPPPTIFSRDHSDARARMPNFTSVTEVSDFVDAARLWRQTKAANIFLIFSTVYFLLVACIAFYVMSHKLYKRCFWVFRVVPRGHSKIIIPNVHTSFTLFITPFLLVLAASSLALILAYARNEPCVSSGLWVSVMWVPLVSAVWYQTWGLLAARLGDGPVSSRKGNGRSLARLTPAWLINVVCLLLPAIPSITGSVLGAVADSHYGQARTGWFEWHNKYDGTSDLTRDMVLDAQNIFHSSIHGAYYLSIALTVWTVTCILDTAAHCYATTTLLYSIGTHLRSKRRGLPLQSFKLHSQPAVPAPNLPASSLPKEVHETDSNSESYEVSATSSRPALSFSRNSGNREDDQGQITTRVFTSEERRQDKSVSFFPSIIPSATVMSLETSKANVVFAFFKLQSVTITLGGLALFADGVYSIVTFYAATEANSFRESFWIAYCLIMTITLLAGTGSVISLAHTTFEDSVATLLFIHGNRNSTVADNSSTAVDEEDTCNTNFLDMEHSRDFSAHRFT